MIDEIKFKTYVVLPLVYDDALSFYELVGKCVQKINEIIPVVNVTNDEIDKKVSEAIQELIDNGTLNDIINNQLFNELNNKMEVIEKDLSDTNKNVGTIETKLALLYSNVVDFGADSTGTKDSSAAFQSALNQNTPGIYIPYGTYLVHNVKIPSNKHVIGYGSKLVAKEGDSIFINAADGVTGGYNANSNITISGIDFSAPGLQCTLIGLGHASNCRIEDCTFHDIANWHMIEINGCNNITIDSCCFYDYKGNSEMLQLDWMSAEQAFPWFGPYDGTGNINTVISNCHFSGSGSTAPWVPAGIGNHSVGEEKTKNVIVSSCTFDGLGSAVKCVSASNFKFDGNIIYNCSGGVFFSNNYTQIDITNNIIIGTSGESVSTDTRGIRTEGQGSYIRAINNFVSSFGGHGITLQGEITACQNNIVTKCSGHGIYSGYQEFGGCVSGNSCFGNSVGSDMYNDFYLAYNPGNLTRVGDILITGNKFSNAKINIEQVDHMQKSVLKGNTIKNTLIITSNASNMCIMQDNMVNNNHLLNPVELSTTKTTTTNITPSTWVNITTLNLPSAGTYIITAKYENQFTDDLLGAIRIRNEDGSIDRRNSFYFPANALSNYCLLTTAITVRNATTINLDLYCNKAHNGGAYSQIFATQL